MSATSKASGAARAVLYTWVAVPVAAGVGAATASRDEFGDAVELVDRVARAAMFAAAVTLLASAVTACVAVRLLAGIHNTLAAAKSADGPPAAPAGPTPSWQPPPPPFA